MKEKKLAAIEYIRGISMLGVIGIHVGSNYLGNPMANIHLTALFEIATRFSVPIFFFISAFGLFYHLDLRAEFDYRNFLKRRFRTVLIPYVFWSLVYLTHYSLAYGDYSLWMPFMFVKFLFFGLFSYQLYFLVILLWFYLLMPLWIAMIRHMTPVKLAALLLFQLAFDYYSSYILSPNFSSAIVNTFVEYRLNYWVLHYFFIFLLGGYAALHFDIFSALLKKWRHTIAVFFVFSLAALLAQYYTLIYVTGYSAESAVNTAHQLSPAGIFYTIGASLFFFALFSEYCLPPRFAALLSIFGKHSYFAYLFHPFALLYLSMYIGKLGYLVTAPAAVLLYLGVAIVSVLLAATIRKIGERFPVVNILTIGVYPKNRPQS